MADSLIPAHLIAALRRFSKDGHSVTISGKMAYVSPPDNPDEVMKFEIDDESILPLEAPDRVPDLSAPIQADSKS